MPTIRDGGAATPGPGDRAPAFALLGLGHDLPALGLWDPGLNSAWMPPRRRHPKGAVNICAAWPSCVNLVLLAVWPWQLQLSCCQCRRAAPRRLDAFAVSSRSSALIPANSESKPPRRRHTVHGAKAGGATPAGCCEWPPQAILRRPAAVCGEARLDATAPAKKAQWTCWGISSGLRLGLFLGGICSHCVRL